MLQRQLTKMLSSRRNPLSTMSFTVKENSSLEARKSESAKIRSKHPHRIPVIVQKLVGSDLPDLDKHKYLVPDEITVSQFIWIIRKRIELSPDRSLFIFLQRSIPPSSAMLGSIYEDFKDEDGYLYVAYSGESTFGC